MLLCFMCTAFRLLHGNDICICASMQLGDGRVAVTGCQARKCACITGVGGQLVRTDQRRSKTANKALSYKLAAVGSYRTFPQNSQSRALHSKGAKPFPEDVMVSVRTIFQNFLEALP